MAIETRTHLLSVAGNAIDTEIAVITASDDEEITILEVGYFFTGAGSLTAFRRNEEMDRVNSLAAPDVDHRVVRNILLKRGDDFTIKGSDTSGAGNVMGMVVVQDRVKK